MPSFQNARSWCWRAFDLGITHFDLAKKAESAGKTFGYLLKTGFAVHGEDMVISYKTLLPTRSSPRLEVLTGR